MSLKMMKNLCSKCKKLKQENDQLKRNLEEILQNKVSEPPRPGKVHPLNARRFQASRRASGTGCAACLLNAFYTNEELKGKNLTGENGISAIDPDILNSILGKHKFQDVQVHNLVIALL
ncbi:uncharacterized protein LOC110062233 isoform X2 [Orbicella faveolata]|uniref:uncharacterized protein LOC110062233 isoform X2 n=1 Tax=Orbicella faveolata TaxID=48498 RepID=UPI0009E357BA|nr:uncharacterized protein LOC110062233 isoform X2 [Orbicella faveolata]